MNQVENKVKKMICVGKKRGFDGGITSYDLIEYGDKERIVKNYSIEYIETAIKRREMVVSNLKLNPEGGLIYVDPNKSKPVVKIEDEDDVDDAANSTNKKKKTYHRKRKSYTKKKKR